MTGLNHLASAVLMQVPSLLLGGLAGLVIAQRVALWQFTSGRPLSPRAAQAMRAVEKRWRQDGEVSAKGAVAYLSSTSRGLSLLSSNFSDVAGYLYDHRVKTPEEAAEEAAEEAEFGDDPIRWSVRELHSVGYADDADYDTTSDTEANPAAYAIVTWLLTDSDWVLLTSAVKAGMSPNELLAHVSGEHPLNIETLDMLVALRSATNMP